MNPDATDAARALLNPRLAFLGGGGEMGERIRGHDWRRSAIGEPLAWPESLKTLVGLMLAAPQPMFIAWGPALTWLYNDAFVPIMGNKHPHGLGRHALDEVWHEAHAVLAPMFGQVFAGEAVHMQDFEITLDRRGRLEEAHFAFSYIPVRGDSGRVEGLFGACIEITERVLADRRREAERQRQRRMFEQAPSFMCILEGPQHVFEFVNDAHRKLFNSAGWIGKPVREAFPEIAGQGYFERLDEVYRTGVRYVAGSSPISYRRLPDGPVEERLLDFVYEPILDDSGSVIGIFCEGTDVTEARRAEHTLREAHETLKHADRRKDAFLATLAHELRNPLAPILQAARIARLPGAGEGQLRWALDVIERQAGHVAVLLDDLLDVSRITHDKLRLRRERVALGTVIATALETARPLLDGRGHVVAVDAPERPVHIDVDPVRLAQVLSNLLTNAARYTEPGGQVTVTARVEGRTLRVAVRDTGIGIAPEMRERLFQPFSQAEVAVGPGGGLGIGLALARSLVGLHGGTIVASSEGAARGSEFVVELPDVVVDEAPSAAAARPAPPAPPRRIVIADDNEDAAETLAALLRMDGHDVRIARDGSEALAALEDGAPPDVMLLDVGMPGISGYDVARQVRAHPAGGPIRLVAVTGWGQAADRARAFEAGFDDHVTKPVAYDALRGLLASAVPRDAVRTGP